ncbi:MAG: hypothetical protein V1799_08285 [bacterium]
MTLFRILSGLTILLLLAGITYDLKRRLKVWKTVRSSCHQQIFAAFNVFKEARQSPQGNILAIIKRAISILTVLCALILAFTGFFPVTILGTHLTGILLVIHVTIAPLFALCLCAVALLWAHKLRFIQEDWTVFRNIIKHQSITEERLARFFHKLAFWIILVLSLPLILTVILELFPLFGTEGEEFLISLHGYSALFLALVGLIHTYLAIMFLNNSREH